MRSLLHASRLSKFPFPIILPIILAVVPATYGQETGLIAGMPATTTVALSAPAETSSVNLPDAPSALLSSLSRGGQSPQEPQPGQPSSSVKPKSAERRWFGLGGDDANRASHMASKSDKYILPGQLAPKLDPSDKLVFGLIHGVSAYGVAGWFVSSGYSHVLNTSPNYGTDKGAYGARLGTAALRGYSNEVLKDAVMANVFHQDPRYYKMGPAHNVAARTAYSVSRILVTRNDEGRLAPNYSLVGGNLLGAALTNAYYPDANRGLGQTARTFGSSMYGAAFSFFASEFLGGALEAVHFKESRN